MFPYTCILLAKDFPCHHVSLILILYHFNHTGQSYSSNRNLGVRIDADQNKHPLLKSLPKVSNCPALVKAVPPKFSIL